MLKQSNQIKVNHNKDGALMAIRKARAFVIFTVGYDGKIRIEADTAKMLDLMDLRELSIKTIESYAHNLENAVLLREKQTQDKERQAGLVAEMKEKRSEELRRVW